MKAKKTKRKAHFGVQLVESPNSITLSFDGLDLAPITFSAKTGQSGKKAHRKLKRVLDAVEAKGEVRTATKTAAKAVTEAVKTASKEAVKAVATRTGNGSDS